MRRILLLGLSLPVALLLVFNLRWVLGGLYSKIGFESYDRPAAASAAHAVSAKLTPWRPISHIWFARSLMMEGKQPDQIRAHFRTALEWAPADAYVWVDYAQILGALNQFDAETELAAARTNQLGPASPTVQATNAAFGLRNWYRGTPALQHEWLRSMSFELRYRPRIFLKKVAADGGAYWLCASAALDLPLAPWCNHVWKTYEMGLLPMPPEFHR